MAGTPHLDFEVSMKAEHCQKAGCDVPFKSFNYDIETTPEEEWKIIVEGKATSHMGHGRTIRELKALMAEEVVVCSNISRDEVIAVVLYTGPMVSPIPKSNSNPDIIFLIRLLFSTRSTTRFFEDGRRKYTKHLRMVGICSQPQYSCWPLQSRKLRMQ